MVWRCLAIISACTAAATAPLETATGFHFAPSQASLGNVIGLWPVDSGFRALAVRPEYLDIGTLFTPDGLTYEDSFEGIESFPVATVVGGSISASRVFGGRWQFGGLFTILQMAKPNIVEEPINDELTVVAVTDGRNQILSNRTSSDTAELDDRESRMQTADDTSSTLPILSTSILPISTVATSALRRTSSIDSTKNPLTKTGSTFTSSTGKVDNVSRTTNTDDILTKPPMLGFTPPKSRPVWQTRPINETIGNVSFAVSPQIMYACPLDIDGMPDCTSKTHVQALPRGDKPYVDMTTLTVEAANGSGEDTAIIFLREDCTLEGVRWTGYDWDPMPGWDSIGSVTEENPRFDRCDSITVAQRVESRSNLEWRDVVVVSGEKKGRSHTELAIGLFKSAAGGESLRFLTAGFLATGLGATNFNLATVGRGSHAIATGVYTVPDGTRKLTVGRHLKLVGDKPHVNPVPSLDNSLEQSLEPFPISGIGSALSRECEWQSVDGGRSVAVDLRFDGAWGGSDVEINFERESIEGPLFKSTVSLDVRATAVKILIDGKVHEHEMALTLDASRVFAVFDPEVLELFVTNKTLVVPVLRPAAITRICVRQISGRSLKLGADSAYYVIGKARVPSAATSIQTGLITILLLAATIIFI